MMTQHASRYHCPACVRVATGMMRDAARLRPAARPGAEDAAILRTYALAVSRQWHGSTAIERADIRAILAAAEAARTAKPPPAPGPGDGGRDRNRHRLDLAAGETVFARTHGTMWRAGA